MLYFIIAIDTKIEISNLVVLNVFNYFYMCFL